LCTRIRPYPAKIPVPELTLNELLSAIAVPRLPLLSSGMIELTVPPPFGIGVDPLPSEYACSVRRSDVSASYSWPVEACDDRFSGKRAVAESPV